jgi:hypothetical protein
MRPWLPLTAIRVATPTRAIAGPVVVEFDGVVTDDLAEPKDDFDLPPAIATGDRLPGSRTYNDAVVPVINEAPAHGTSAIPIRVTCSSRRPSPTT